MAFKVTGYFKAGGTNYKPGDVVDNLDQDTYDYLAKQGYIEVTKAADDPAAAVPPAAPAAPAPAPQPAPAAPQQPTFEQQIANDPQLQ